MRTRAKTTVVTAAALILSMCGATLTLHEIDRRRPQATLEEVLYVRSAATLRRLALGYSGLLADIYWTRAVQYFGGHHVAEAKQYNLLYPLLDITSRLDPHLIVAYRFGAIFLTEPPPEGAGQPDRAVELVERGIRENPQDWHLYLDLGSIHYLDRKDYDAAREAFERGARLPNANPALGVMAAAIATYAGEWDIAWKLWNLVLQSNTDKTIRENAEKHLRALLVDRAVPLLEAEVEKYRKQYGTPPASFSDMVRAGLLPGIPLDPLSRPYKLSAGGRIEVADPDRLPFITKGLPPGRKPTPSLPPTRNEPVH